MTRRRYSSAVKDVLMIGLLRLEAREIVVADSRKPELRGPSVRRQPADAQHLREDRAERRAPLLEVLQRLGRERVLKATGVVVFGFRRDSDQLLRVRDGQRSQCGVEQAIQGRVCTKADRQSQHTRRRERLVCPQETNGVPDFVHVGIVARRRELFLAVRPRLQRC